MRYREISFCRAWSMRRCPGRCPDEAGNQDPGCGRVSISWGEGVDGCGMEGKGEFGKNRLCLQQPFHRWRRRALAIHEIGLLQYGVLETPSVCSVSWRDCWICEIPVGAIPPWLPFMPSPRPLRMIPYLYLHAPWMTSIMVGAHTGQPRGDCPYGMISKVKMAPCIFFKKCLTT